MSVPSQRGQLVREAIAFGWVGAVGFVVDAAILTWLVTGLDWSSYGARLISFGAAVSVTWILNRRWTFRHRATHDRRREYWRYFAVQSGGALLNYGIFAFLIALVPEFAEYPVVPLAAGSGVAMFFNFALSRTLVYRQRPASTPLEVGASRN